MTWLMAIVGKRLPEILAGLAVLVVLGGTFIAGSRHGANRVQAKWDAAALETEREFRRQLALINEAMIEQQRVDAERARELAAFLAAERAVTERLRAAVRRAQLVTREEPTHENPHPAPRLSDAFRLCWNAHFTGDPADRAACEASTGPLSDGGGR